MPSKAKSNDKPKNYGTRALSVTEAIAIISGKGFFKAKG